MERNLFLLAIACAVYSCNNDGSIQEAGNDSSLYHDSIELANQSEFEKYSGLPIDSIKIQYKNQEDFLYGFRSDSIIVMEGDMKFLLPQYAAISHDFEKEVHGRRTHKEKLGTKIVYGVGTKARLWPVVNGMIQVPYMIQKSFPD